MIRVAAVGDVHFGVDSSGTFRPHLEDLESRADVLLLAGDLTTCGHPDEAAVLGRELADLGVPVIAVLGNHDFHAGREQEVRDVLEGAGVLVLEGESTVLDVGGRRLGIAGVKGFGGGFAGACGTAFGEPEMKAFVGHTAERAEALERALATLRTDVRIVLLHYAPIKATLLGERLEIYPFLGSHLFGEAADRIGADLVLHGHAHRGTEKGVTPGGIHVRNVSQPVVRSAYALYSLGGAVGAARQAATRAVAR